MNRKNLLPKTKNFEPLFGFALVQALPFLRRLFCRPFAAQLLLDVIPENVRFYGCCPPRTRSRSQSPVTADDCQAFWRRARTYFVLDYRIGIGSQSGKKDFQTAYMLESALIRRSRTVKNNLALFSGQLNTTTPFRFSKCNNV